MKRLLREGEIPHPGFLLAEWARCLRHQWGRLSSERGLRNAG